MWANIAPFNSPCHDRKANQVTSPQVLITPFAATPQVDSESQFLARVSHEWRRAERSGRPSLLFLFSGFGTGAEEQARFIAALARTLRDTDVLGWFKSRETLGAICVELGTCDVAEARQAILKKIDECILHSYAFRGQPIQVAVHVLPPFSEHAVLERKDADAAENLWRAVFRRKKVVSIQSVLDTLGAFVLLLMLSPLLLVIAVCIRMTSKGPAIFCQTRVGARCQPFSIYKFRTMTQANDNGQHQNYVKQFIRGTAEQQLDDCGKPLYKLAKDSRVTPLGKILRRTSLDELPQLWNVLRGDMSLVGPRPILTYEVEHYSLWHRRRVFEAKPGLTGLWQVHGRSRCNFDEMIRLDLGHTKPQTLGLYLKVLLRTPGAVIRGSGAC